MATLTKSELKKYLKECIREMIKEGNPDLKALVNECVVSSLGLGTGQQQQKYVQQPMFPQQQPSPYANLVTQFAGNDPTQQLIFGDIANKMYQAELAERQALLEEQQYEMQQQQQQYRQTPQQPGRGATHAVPHSPYGQQQQPVSPASKSRWAELAFNTQPLNTDPRLLG